MKRKYINTIRVLTGAMVYMMVVTGCGSSSDSYTASKSAADDAYYATEEAAEGGVYDAAYDEAYDN